MIPRFLKSAFTGFEVLDVKEWLMEGRIEVYLEAKDSCEMHCFRCGEALGVSRGKYPVKLEGMPVMGLKLFIHFMRHKGHCKRCKKARAEKVEFISPESPHLTQDYAYWLGRLCEIAAVSRAAELVGMEAITLWRHDHARMRRMLKNYKVPLPTHIAVDEVYARSKKRFEAESRDDLFFTVISDLKTRKVLWVSESRAKKGLDEFFALIGTEACKKIEVVTIDQHDPYKASIEEHCPQAVIVWDRFHLMQSFSEAVNETRKELFEFLSKSDAEIARLARGKNRFIFLEKDSRRTHAERAVIEDVARRNKKFLYLELIKERMFDLFNQPTAEDARKVFDEVGDWIWQQNFEPLMKWHKNLELGWETLKNFFTHRFTTGLAEARNNVIKTLKKRAYGYRNMDYFRLKIMQVCGYLNSKFQHLDISNTCTNM